MTETEIVEVSHVVRKDLCFNTKNILSDSLNMIFLQISSQKLNQLQWEYLTRSNANDFLKNIFNRSPAN